MECLRAHLSPRWRAHPRQEEVFGALHEERPSILVRPRVGHLRLWRGLRPWLGPRLLHDRLLQILEGCSIQHWCRRWRLQRLSDCLCCQQLLPQLTILLLQLLHLHLQPPHIYLGCQSAESLVIGSLASSCPCCKTQLLREGRVQRALQLCQLHLENGPEATCSPASIAGSRSRVHAPSSAQPCFAAPCARREGCVHSTRNGGRRASKSL
mmetsp:Transcript_81680/g.135036  ORF Transcript_81680/g.135036 Transcript_81680/m.135036 type:complete len:210 (+) Transcript_81680:1855-2484(+)